MHFTGGPNIAMKTPAHQFEATVAFYRDVLKLPVRRQSAETVSFQFGESLLHIDRMPGLSQAEVWLQLVTDDLDAAARHLAQSNIPRCDDIEPLPEGFHGFWISGPQQVIHLVDEG